MIRSLSISALIVVLALAGCSRAQSNAGPQKALFAYTCCRASDMTATYRPGQTMVIHWIVTSTATQSRKSALPVELSAGLSGPFADVVLAKDSPKATRNAVSATPLKISESTGGSPTSRITIPTTAGTGYFNLTTSINDGGGVVTNVGTIHVVASPGRSGP
ncbi:MAG: hypothetical protein QOH54_2837 [Mycobacterium sp.]|jgi:hypothetical protein|nr:hypothetical protein [Mycobacterium sp.]